MRCICLSHETALEFWRLWSARNGIALHLFHCRKTMQTDDLPFRIFPSSPFWWIRPQQNAPLSKSLMVR